MIFLNFVGGLSHVVNFRWHSSYQPRIRDENVSGIIQVTTTTWCKNDRLILNGFQICMFLKARQSFASYLISFCGSSPIVLNLNGRAYLVHRIFLLCS